MSEARRAPRRGEIWVADTGPTRKPHWVVVVSVDNRNLSDNIGSVLVVPFGSMGIEGPTTLRLEAHETGLPGPAYLKGHFVATERKSALREHVGMLTGDRMKEVVLLVHRAIDPDAPARAVLDQPRQSEKP